MSSTEGPTPEATGAGQNHAGDGESTPDPELSALVGPVLEKLDRLTQLEEANAASLDREDRPRAHVNRRTGAFEIPRETRAMPLLIPCDTVQPESVEWLWPGYLAAGKLTILGGRAGEGKSLVATDLSARISRGSLWPDGSPACRPGRVVFASLEDGLPDVVVPRLLAARADLAMIDMLQVVEVDRREELLNLGRHLSAIEIALAKPGVRLVVLDPLDAMLGGVETHKSADLRSVLQPVACLAEKYRVALLIVHHLRKSGGCTANERLSGSFAIGACARIVALAARDPGTPERRYLGIVKSNLAREARPLSYSIVEDENGRPAVAWDANAPAVDMADLLLVPDERNAKRQAREAPAVGEAVEFLRGALDGRVVPVRELESQGREAGISTTALRRARQQLGLRARPGAFGGPYVLGPLGRGTDGASDPVSSVSTTSRGSGRDCTEPLETGVLKPSAQSRPDPREVVETGDANGLERVSL